MVGRSTAERLADIRAAATDLRDIVADMATDAFHALPHADRLAYRAIKNALTELGKAVKALPADIGARCQETPRS
jgi:uncharacterized protein with HEPN domain